MGLLKKFISSLSFPSPAAGSKGVPRREFVKRAPRIGLNPLQGLLFSQQTPFFTESIQLANISTTGIGFFKSSHPQWPAAGTTLGGELSFSGKKCEISARIVHFTDQIVGCVYEGESSQLRSMIHRYFDMELSALSTSQAKPEHLQTDSEGTPHWIYGNDNCDLYFVVNDGKIVRFSLTFFGRYIEGGDQTPVKFGQIVHESAAEKPRHKESDLIRWESNPPEELVKNALRFIQHIPYLTSEQSLALTELILARPVPRPPVMG